MSLSLTVTGRHSSPGSMPVVNQVAATVTALVSDESSLIPWHELGAAPCVGSGSHPHPRRALKFHRD